MKAAIYNPYWDTLGGGERYAISLAKSLTEMGYFVDIEWKDQNLLENIENRFGLIMKNVRIVDSVKKGDGYDLCFWVSDGSIPILHSRNNILHFQVPFNDVNGDSLLNKMKLFRIKSVICNSNFTKSIIDREYHVNSIVIYPPCDTTKIKPKRKENLILSVGRFSQLLQSKHQDVLITAFKILNKKNLKDWKLVFAGGTDVGGVDFLNKLKLLSKNYPIEFYENPTYKEIINLYGRAKIFWSASGYGANHTKHPQKLEHFGISLVEAMASGCLPLVYNGGGHKEIVENQKTLLWKSINGLTKKTLPLTVNSKNNRELTKELIERSKFFSYEIFSEKIRGIV